MENHIIVPMGEITGYKNTEEDILEQELKKPIDVIEDLFDTKNHVIKHPEALYTEPLISEIMNLVSVKNFSKKQVEKLEVKQSISWKKIKFASFNETKN